ncbi:MAG: c-type cytochrome [Anaerolineales bacterium]|nr:c-type cytochrome [Anaerolineales bacterium]
MRYAKWLVAIATLTLLLVIVGAVAAQGSEGDPERGGELFVKNCAVCHGIDGKGRVGASLEAFPGIQVDSALRQIISEGISGSVMPAWLVANGGPFSEQDIDDVTAYVIVVFDGTSPIAPAPTYVAPDIEPIPGVEGDPSAGAVVYQENCAVCHGEQGEGRFGRPLAKEWPGNQPEVFIRQVTRDGIPGTTMPAWAMENGGPLTDVDIDNLTVYVLTLQPVENSPIPAPETEGPISLTVGILLLVGMALLVIIVLVIYYRRA